MKIRRKKKAPAKRKPSARYAVVEIQLIPGAGLLKGYKVHPVAILNTHHKGDGTFYTLLDAETKTRYIVSELMLFDTLASAENECKLANSASLRAINLHLHRLEFARKTVQSLGT